MKVPSVENPELTNVLHLKPGAGQNIATHAFPTTRNLFLVLISTSRSIRLHFFKPFPLFSTALALANAVSRAGPRNQIGHPARSHKRFKQVPVVSAYGI